MPLIPIDWLADHVEIPDGLSAAELAEALVKVGLEEEEIHRPDVTGPIVVGKVLTLVKEEQKNGKLINYCRVDVGKHNDEPGSGKEPSDLPSRGIICGAHNFAAGDYVVVSLPGAVLPGDFAIATRKTYGHISDGMICSKAELGLGEDHDGIIVLAKEGDTDAIAAIPAPGEDVLEFLGLSGEVLEINVTPDRGYCFAMRGVAREFAHSTGAKFTDRGLAENLAQPLPQFNNTGFSVVVEDEAPIHNVIGCDRFVTRIVRGVNPEARSPQWMQDRLSAAGMRPISLAVDVTNYVMLDLGQPLHAYDLDKLEAPIVVRRAKPGEHLTTLDGVDRELNAEDLVITDSAGGHGAHVIGLAGTMGGFDTEITAETTNILIEAAHFDSISVARMARRHRLPSEASKRFERGVDRSLPPVAAQRVAQLLVQYGGGTIEDANFEVNTARPAKSYEFPVDEVKRLTGLTTSQEDIIALLGDIGCDVQATGQDGIVSVTPPLWRPDLIGKAHFVEEIARLVGYDEIASVLPPAPAGRGLTSVQRQRRDVMRALAEQGWTQVVSYPFVSAASFEKQGIDDDRRNAIKLHNPLQEEAPFMRTSLLDSLLDIARLNVARSNPSVAVFETGLVTRPANILPAANPGVGQRPSDIALASLMQALPAQPYHIAGVATPSVTQAVAGFPATVWDWRDAVEAVNIIAATLGVKTTLRNAQYAPFHPGRCAQVFVGDVVVGYAGELAPKVVKAFDLPARSIAFEVNADALFALRGDDPLAVSPVAVFPAAKEDIALVVDESVSAKELLDVVVKAAGDLGEDIRIFDLYTGDQIPEGKKSVAFALRLRAVDHTLTAEETATIRNKIVKMARKAYGAELRA